jgi:spore coat protein U-like protein
VTRTLALLPLLVLASVAQAQTACRIATASPLAFGDYEFLAATPKDSQAIVIVTCDRDGGPQVLPLLMRIDQGTGGAGPGGRRMTHAGGAGDTLSYGLYRDVARSSVWGTSDNVDTVTLSLSVPNKGSASANFTIYGRIPARQDVSAGFYVDRVQITLLY